MHRLFRYWSGSSDAIHDDDESKEDEVEHEHELELEHERDGGCENVDDQVNTENPGGAAGTESADFGVDETVGEGCDVPTNSDEAHIKVHVEESEDITMHQDNNSSDAHKFEQINEDLVIPHSIATTSTTNNTTQELPLHSPNKDHQNNHSDLNDEHDDSFPKAKDFLADLLFITEENYADENETIQIPPEQASEIVCGFDQDENNDARTVITQRTAGTVMSTASRRLPPSSFRSMPNGEKKDAAHGIHHEHESIFHILERNFEELGDCRGDGRDIGYRDVKLWHQNYSLMH